MQFLVNSKYIQEYYHSQLVLDYDQQFFLDKQLKERKRLEGSFDFSDDALVIELDGNGVPLPNKNSDAFIEQRKKMIEGIMKAFDDDEFFKGDADAFDDKMFDQIRKQGFRGFQGFNSSGNNVKVEEKIEEDGSISVIITPKSKNIKLDIQTTNDQIVIKSERMSDVENKNE